MRIGNQTTAAMGTRRNLLAMLTHSPSPVTESKDRPLRKSCRADGAASDHRPGHRMFGGEIRREAGHRRMHWAREDG